MSSEAVAVRILSRTIVASPTTIGSLMHTLNLSSESIVNEVRMLVQQGALSIAFTVDGTQLAVMLGKPQAIEAFADDNALVRTWLQLRAERDGNQRQLLHTNCEFVSIATDFSQRASAMTVLLPGADSPSPTTHHAKCLKAIRLACAHQITPSLVVPRSVIRFASSQALLSAVTALGITPRLITSIDSPMICWHGIGAIYLLPDSLIFGLRDVSPYAVACLEASLSWQDGAHARVIQLLAEGLTDAVAARRMGMSERQFRRHVCALMKQLGSSSRFQAGFLAARTIP